MAACGGAFAQAKCGLNNGKATGEPIPIGAVVGKTGPDDFSASAQAAAAYFKCVNANGGINGRPIDFIVADDQWNPETAAQVASKLVKDRKVVALAGSTSFVECGANAKMYADEGDGHRRHRRAARVLLREELRAHQRRPAHQRHHCRDVRSQDLQEQADGLHHPQHPRVGNWGCEGAKEWGKANGVQVETLTIDPGSADATLTMLQAASKSPDAIIMNVPKGKNS